MQSLALKVAAFAATFFCCAFSIASGQVPSPSAVPAQLPDKEREELTQTRAALDLRRAALGTRIRSLNAKCSKVEAGTPLADECRAEKAHLEKDIANYTSAVREFNDAVIRAQKATPRESGDPSVVDGRNVPSGLWKGMDEAIATAYGDAPPGVGDRVRKGFQAVMERDWKVAKAWFEDALNRDPANAGLKRLVALVDVSQTPSKPSAPASPKKDGPRPEGVWNGIDLDGGLYIMFPGLKELEEKQLMDLLFGIDGPAAPAPPVTPKPAGDPGSPLPAKAVVKPNWKALFDALLKNPPKSKYPQVGAVRD